MDKEFLKKGFTLVEVLIVITIIAILIAIVMASFKSAIVKSRNSRIASDLAEVKKLAERIYIDSGGAGYTSICYTGQLSENLQETRLLKEDIEKLGGTTYCYANASSYCVNIQLADNQGYLCVDDEGHFGQSQYRVCVSPTSNCP